MSLASATAHLKNFKKDKDIITVTTTTATVDTAAGALGVTGNEIAKSITLYNKPDGIILIVTAGHQKVDSQKFKARFGFKANMVKFDEVEAQTGHPPGGVCPFGVNENVSIYLDESLKNYAYVYPACGSLNTSIKLSIEELSDITDHKGWVDVTKAKE